MAGRIPAAPEETVETRRFWEAARDGRLMIGSCRSCGQVHFYPRGRCPYCLSAETELKEATGHGTLYSVSVMRRAKVPYAIAYVRLDEGVTMMSNVVECGADDLRIGMALEVVFQASASGQPVPMFRPAGAGR